MRMSAHKAPSHFAFECLISLKYCTNRILFSFLESSFSTMTVNMAYVIYLHRAHRINSLSKLSNELIYSSSIRTGGRYSVSDTESSQNRLS